jgi:hypothetical protein
MIADLAISGTSTDTFGGKTCSVTLAYPIQYVAWWMLTFPVDTVYIKNVQIYYRRTSEYFFSYKYFFQVYCRGGIQDFKLGGTLKKIAPSGGRRENCWGISWKKNHDFTQKNHIFSNSPCAPPHGSAPALSYLTHLNSIHNF